MTSTQSIPPLIEESLINGDKSNLSFTNFKKSPRSRTKHSCCIAGGHLYVFGGRDGNIGLKDSWRYNIERNSWEYLEFNGSKLPFLEDHTSTAIDNKIIIFGGNFENDFSSPLWTIDMGTLECSNIQIEDPLTPISRRGHAVSLYEKDLYIFGGFVDFFGCTDELWKFNSAQFNSAKFKSAQLKSAKWELLYSRQGSLKLSGQRNFKSSIDSSKFSQSYSSDIYSQSPSLLTSVSGPSARCFQACAVLGDDMYIHGGERGNKILASFWKWSFVAGNWLHLKAKPCPPPFKRHNMVAAGPTTLLIIGGETRDNVGMICNWDIIPWGFDINASSWFKLADPNGHLPKITLSGFSAINVSDVVDSNDCLSLVTLWNDSETLSVGNVTEITDSCSAMYSQTSFLEDTNDVSSANLCPNYPTSKQSLPSQHINSAGGRPLANDCCSFQDNHREAARKLSGHDPKVGISNLPCPSIKASLLYDIEMDNLDDNHKLLQREAFTNGLLSFDNDSFDPIESNSGRRSSPAFSSEFVRSGDLCAIDLSFASRSNGTQRERKHYRLALVGGKTRNKRGVSISPMSVIMLTVTNQNSSCQVNDILFY